MKKVLVILCLLVSVSSYGQEQLATAPPDSVTNTWDLDHQAWKAWEQIDSVWMATAYWNILKSHKIKMSCAHCERVMMHVDMQIDSTGALQNFRIEKTFLCGSEFSEQMKEEFLQYFREITFPPELRNRVIHTLLGTGLKC